MHRRDAKNPVDRSSLPLRFLDIDWFDFVEELIGSTL
jgi:hypothetical protein